MSAVATASPAVSAAGHSPVATTVPVAVPVATPVITGHRAGGRSPLVWVSDSADERRCVAMLLARSDLARGVVTVLAPPGAPWPVLARDLLLALGKDRRALVRLGRARLVELARLWTRAEQVRHLVVLRAHQLPAATLAALEDFARRTAVVPWAVAHGPNAASPAAPAWTAVLARLDREPVSVSTPSEVYGRTHDLAHRAGRSWRLYTERTLSRLRQVRPGCELGTLLQNLTIDALDPDDLRLRLHAAVNGLRDAGLILTLPDPHGRLLGHLGPRFDTDTVTRLRRLACPTSAAALTLAVATGNDAPHLALLRRHWTDPAGRHVRAYTGTCRVPPQARASLRALLAHHATRVDPAPALLLDRDGRAMGGLRIAHAITNASRLTGLDPGAAAWAHEKTYTAETFAAPFTGACTLTSLTPSADLVPSRRRLLRPHPSPA